MSGLKKLLYKKKYIQIPLKKMITNHMEHKIEFFKLDAKESDTKAAGAGATDMETQQSENNNLKIGKWKNENFSLVLFDLVHVNKALTLHDAEEVHGIIGADILQKGKAVIDYNKNVLYLKKIKKQD